MAKLLGWMMIFGLSFSAPLAQANSPLIELGEGRYQEGNLQAQLVRVIRYSDGSVSTEAISESEAESEKKLADYVDTLSLQFSTLQIVSVSVGWVFFEDVDYNHYLGKTYNSGLLIELEQGISGTKVSAGLVTGVPFFFRADVKAFVYGNYFSIPGVNHLDSPDVAVGVQGDLVILGVKSSFGYARSVLTENATFFAGIGIGI